MLGWITVINQTDTAAFEGELLSCDGKFYNFLPTHLAKETALSCLVPTQAVSFEPVGGQAFYPYAGNIRLAEEPSPAFDEIRSKMRTRLSAKRYLHCFKVSKITRRFAEKEGYDADKAELSGLLHDIAKEIPNEENARIIVKNKLPVSSFELGYHHILHAMAGYVVAKQDFGITDPDVLDGIRYHNGRPAMGMMDKLTFIGDHIDQLHKLGVNGNYIADAPTLDEAIYKMILEVNLFYVRRRGTPDFVTECTMNYLLHSIGKADTPEPAGSSSAVSDELFDAALDTTVRQSVHLSSVPNARQLGGYRTASGKHVRQNRLIRASWLRDLTFEDAAHLRELGIDTVIDLRTPDEIAESPDRNVDPFRYIPCPLPTVETDDFQKMVSEKFSVTNDIPEKNYYLSEFLSYLNMAEMYLNVLTGKDAVDSLKRVFAVLLDDDTHGVLFHCTSGKDRTGIVSALILLLLGATLPDIRADYYASAVSGFAATEALVQRFRREQYPAETIDAVRYYIGIGKNIAEGTYHQLIEDYGSPEVYFSEVLCLTQTQQDRLREKYLEK